MSTSNVIAAVPRTHKTKTLNARLPSDGVNSMVYLKPQPICFSAFSVSVVPERLMHEEIDIKEAECQIAFR